MAITQNGALKRDDNDYPVMGGTSSVDNTTIINAAFDPVTRRLLTDTSGGGGTGTVTSVSVVTANGVSGSVATPTTTPAITLTLGAITPTTVNGNTISTSSGTLTLGAGKTATISNTLTLTGTDGSSVAFGTGGTVLYGNQTITLSGDVTGSGSTAITTTVAKIAGTAVSGTTGSGNVVFATSPTLTTAVLGSSTATTQPPSDNSTKVATTAYVDAAILGQNFKEAAKYATTAALATVVYSNGSSGVGATLTAVGVGALSLDGSTPSVNDRILVKNQASTFQNGIYTVTIVGTGATVFVLTRATDANLTGEFKTGDFIFVTAGTANTSTTWAYTGIDSPVIGTDAITYAQSAGQGTVTSGNGITVTGLSVAIDTSVTVDKNTAQTLTNKTLTSPTLTTPALGTPASGVMTNVTGVPAAAILAGSFGAGAYVISTSLQAATIELGAATDTTLSRVSAGVIAVEGVTVPTISSTNTLTNKRVTRRSATTNAPGATPTTNTDNVDVQIFTGLAANITSFTTNLSGTPTSTDFLEYWLTDNGTGRTLVWGASFAATTVALPTTTVASTKLRVLFEWGGSTWDCVAVA